MKRLIMALPVVLCVAVLPGRGAAQQGNTADSDAAAENNPPASSSLDALFGQATFWRANNRPDLARDALQRVLAVEPANSRALRGMGELALAEATAYLAAAPKSNAVYVAYKAAMRAAKGHGSLLPPKHILNAPTGLMKDEGYGSGYLYDHDQPDGFSGQDYFPEEMGRQRFYEPTERGAEKRLGEHLTRLARLRAERSGGGGRGGG